jgi:hypothetical protein
VVGLLAICLGFIPLFGLGAIMGGIIAVIFGLLGFTRARRGIATNKKMSLFGTVAGVIAGALGIWGLVIVGNAFTQLDNTIKGAAPSAAAPEAPGAPADASTPEESTTGAFGQNITWPDGVAVTVSEPKAYRPSSSAATDQAAARYVSMTVTVTNGSDKNIEATGTTLAATANGTPADQVFDRCQGHRRLAELDSPAQKVDHVHRRLRPAGEGAGRPSGGGSPQLRARLPAGNLHRTDLIERPSGCPERAQRERTAPASHLVTRPA